MMIHYFINEKWAALCVYVNYKILLWIENQSDSVPIGICGFDIMHILLLVGGSLGEPHSNMENGMVVHMQRTMMKNGIATYYCSLVQWFMYKQTW